MKWIKSLFSEIYFTEEAKQLDREIKREFARIDNNIDKRANMKWISVKDRLPDKNTSCLVYRYCELTDWEYPPPKYDLIQVSYFIKQYNTFTVNGWTVPQGIKEAEISHWMDIEDIPKPDNS